MKFYNGSQEKSDVLDETDICLCHNEYNHCVANNENGEIPEIIPSEDIENLDYLKKFPSESMNIAGTTTTTTTQAPEIREALGFDVCKIKNN
uniref:Uncharacterized protein n=1 Tax=Panagrolaimus superbus TaxID=310955 RepID=A0A914Y1L3_9BILA